MISEGKIKVYKAAKELVDVLYELDNVDAIPNARHLRDVELTGLLNLLAQEAGHPALEKAIQERADFAKLYFVLSGKPYPISKEELDLIKAGNLISAIKNARNRCQISLKEAKDMCSHYAGLVQQGKM